MSKRGASSDLLLLFRPTVLCWVCLLALLAAFHIDYWGSVHFFQSRGVWVTTDIAGRPMPVKNALDIEIQLGLPLGLLGFPVAALDLMRGRRLLSVLEVTCSAGMLILALFCLGMI